MEREILLGKGVLNWNRGERVTDRYGTVKLYKNAGYDCEETVELLKINVGTVGQLIVVVDETRESGHVGDWARGISPSTPKVGDRFVLGEGKIFYDYEYGQDSVGLEPLKARDNDWLDPHILYKVHEQTVRLYFKPS